MLQNDRILQNSKFLSRHIVKRKKKAQPGKINAVSHQTFANNLSLLLLCGRQGFTYSRLATNYVTLNF